MTIIALESSSCYALVAMRMIALLLAFFLSTTASAQHLLEQKIFDAIAGEYSGESAQENTRRIVEYHRIQGSPMMVAVAEQVVLPRLKEYGVEAKIEQFPSDGKTRYGTYLSPMGWDMRRGELWIESAGSSKDFKPIMLCRYADVPMCVSTYSPGGEWAGELVDVGSGVKDSDYRDKAVQGKVALASGYAANVVRQAVLKHGAVGVVTYPAAGDRPDHPDMIRYNGIWPRAEELEKTRGGFQISRNQYKAMMRSGPVRVHGKIDATRGPGKLTLVHAYIPGAEHPEREVLVTGHLDHPKWSANDNASGSGAMMESVRTLQTLIAARKISVPRLTLHFIWVPEIFGTLAYVSNHPEARRCDTAWDDPRNKPEAFAPGKPCVVANINTDMVGEDTVKTNSRFYFTRAPDSVPSFLDALMSDVLQQTREASLYAPTGTRNYWLAEAIAYAQGNDHDAFLGLGIPATMLGHDPDWTHHTSEDKIDKTDASEFRRVGVLASAAAYWMAAADFDHWDRLRAGEIAARVEVLAQRVASDVASGPVGAAERIKKNEDELEEASKRMRVASRHNFEAFTAVTDSGAQKSTHANAPPPYTSKLHGLQRLTLLPIDASAFEGLSNEDARWVSQQEGRFSSVSEGLATKPNFALISFEAVNFMNGQRGKAEIASLLSAEFLIDLDKEWVDHLVSILAKQHLLALGHATSSTIP